MQLQSQTLLVIGKVWPEPASSAAGTRMMQLLRFFQAQGADVHFACAAQESEFSTDLRTLGMQCHFIQLNNSSFDDFVKDLQPAVAIYDRFSTEEQFGWRLRANCPDCLQLLDTEDLHGLRSAREQAVKNQSEPDYRNTVLLRELSSIYRCDLSLIISEHEQHFLQTELHVPSALLHYLPLLEEPNIEAQSISFSQRKDFVSIGNFLHAPNKDAVLYLRDVVWPLIHARLPDAKMLVYGAYADDAVMQWTQAKNNFFVKGRAENADLVMQQARVSLAPLRYGAGQKGKLLLAMRNATPSVTTEIGAEGMRQQTDWPGAIVNEAETFAEAAVSLYSNDGLWKKAQTICSEHLQYFSAEKHLPNLEKRLLQLRAQLQTHRFTNVTGSLLNYQANHSTRYMSLWIEAKNKLNQ